MWLDGDENFHAPEVEGRWLNSPVIRLSELLGRVVLVDFWDYTCVNCIRTLPYLKEWDRRYRGHGLTVIGVHTPEFHFARSSENVERARRELGLSYPVVMDNEYQVWQAYRNRCWPAKYLVDQKGHVRFVHFGEGAYGETEDAIQRLLREIDPACPLPTIMNPVRDMDRPGARCLPVTPELYLGFSRGRLGNESGYAANEVKDYQDHRPRSASQVCLEGPWFAGSESVMACPLEARPSRLLVACNAAEVNLVMRAPEELTALVTLTLDGAPPRPEEAGADVVRQAERSVVSVREPRMYRLVNGHRVEARLLEISTQTPGLEAYAFTFVSCIA